MPTTDLFKTHREPAGQCRWRQWVWVACLLAGLFLVVARAEAAHGYVAELDAWGYGGEGQLGNGSTNDSPTPSPVNLPAGVGPTAAASGGIAAYAAGSDGNVYAWGLGALGALGDGSTSDSYTPVRVELPSALRPVSVAGDNYGGYALMSDGTIYAWGIGMEGELGDGSMTNSSTPVRVALPPGVAAKAIAAGLYTAYAIGSDGHLYAWGYGGEGQLGDGSTATSLTPVQVNLPAGVVATSIAAGARSAYAVGSDGDVYAWGQGSNGQLGDGSTGEALTPVKVAMPSQSTGVEVAAANWTAYALVSTGKVYAWGLATDGDLGDGYVYPFQVEAPVEVDMPASAVSLGAGAWNGYAVSSDGSLYAWGDNAAGQLGNGTISEAEARTPTHVSLPTGTTGITVASGLSDSAFAIVQMPVTVPPTPRVERVSPKKGPASGGTDVEIVGTGFTEVSAVRFGTTSAAGFTVISPTSIDVISPPRTTGTTDITVTTSGGTSVISRADHFLYGAPTVTSVSPSTGPTNGGSSVAITGSGFGLGSATTMFKFGNMIAGSVSCTSSTTCTVETPAGKAGTVDVRAIVQKHKSKKTVADRFTYQ